MKKRIIFLILSILIIFCFYYINRLDNRNYETSKNNSYSSDEIIKIMEPVYLDYVQEINLNPKEYIGKTIEIEGIFTSIYDEIQNRSIYYVYRLSDSVHYHEDEEEVEEVMSGFEFNYDGEMPKENDWIKVIGVIEKEDDNLIIKANSITVLEERGLEKVDLFY